VAVEVKRRQGPITRALPFPAQISHYMTPLVRCSDGRHECKSRQAREHVSVSEEMRWKGRLMITVYQ
jgi:hypothetical protein